MRPARFAREHRVCRVLIQNSLRVVCLLGGSAVNFSDCFHRRGAENAENSQRQTQISHTTAVFKTAGRGSSSPLNVKELCRIVCDEGVDTQTFGTTEPCRVVHSPDNNW